MVSIVGINEVGEEEGNDNMPEVAALPWLQDTTDQDAWGQWVVDWRDVVVLDGDNIEVGRMNLTDESLEEEANRETLRALLADAGA